MNSVLKKTKAKSKGAKLAAKKASKLAAGGFDIAEVPRKLANGRTPRTRAQKDARTDQLDARCRTNGIEVSAANRRKMLAPWNGTPEGKVIEGVKGEEARQRLWGAAQLMVGTWEFYYRAHAMPSPYAKCSSILQPTEEMHADAASPAVDDRSDEQKQRDAVSAKMRIEGWLGRISAFAAMECKQVVLGGKDCRDEAGLLAALRIVADGRDGRF